MSEQHRRFEKKKGARRLYWQASLKGCVVYFVSGEVGFVAKTDFVERKSNAAAERVFAEASNEKLEQGYVEVPVEPTAGALSAPPSETDRLQASLARFFSEPVAARPWTIEDVVRCFERFAADPETTPRTGWSMTAGAPAETGLFLPPAPDEVEPAWALELAHHVTIDHHPIASARCVFLLAKQQAAGLPEYEQVAIPRWGARRFFVAVRASVSYAELLARKTAGRCVLNWHRGQEVMGSSAARA